MAGLGHQVGLGLYNHSFEIAMAVDLGIFILGIVIYVTYIVKKRCVRIGKTV
jgi:hypothetical protein